MINSLIGKVQGDGSVSFVFCSERGDMGNLGATLLSNYNSEELVDKLLQQGHCKFPGDVPLKKWTVVNKIYISGEGPEETDNALDFLDRGVEEVQTIYLYRGNKWFYANTMAMVPKFVAVMTAEQRIFRCNSKRPFYSSI